MSDSKYIYDSREIVKTSGKANNTINNDIEHIRDLFPDEANQFTCFASLDYQYIKYYKMTQKGYDLLKDYWKTKIIYKPFNVILATDNQMSTWAQFKSKVSEPESNITSEPLEKYAKEYIKKYQPIGGNNTMVYNTTSNAPVAKSAPTDEPRCKKLLELWYDKSKTNLYITINTKFGELLKKDPLTQKIVQSLQTIRVLWGTDHPGEDDERQKQYENGPGHYFELWMRDYGTLVKSTKIGFWESAYLNRLTYTTATERLLKRLEEKSKQLLKDLDTKCTETLLQINAADTYEQETQILKAYGVLDTNGIISPAPVDEITIPSTSEE